MSTNVRVKVSLPLATKAALQSVADSLNMSLSSLIVESAVIGCLGSHEGSLAKIGERLAMLERALNAAKDGKAVLTTDMTLEALALIDGLPRRSKTDNGIRQPDRRSDGSVIYKHRKGADVLMSQADPVFQVDRTEQTIGLYDLIDRFCSAGASKVGLVARLCQLGGRDGQLFQGSLSHAKTVASKTASLDPDGLPWMPLSVDRRFWVQMDAEEYAKEILGKNVVQPCPSAE